MSTDDDYLKLLKRFAGAWNAHDADALMSMMTDDCVFLTAMGRDPHGTEFRGRDAVRAAFQDVWRLFPDAQWLEDKHVVSGSRGFSEWTFHGTDLDGKRHVVRGIDLFTLRDGKIVVKDTFRKRPA
ncbi:MAG: nuclear transport factor 2 family protein [Hyphomicrobiales bacterium]